MSSSSTSVSVSATSSVSVSTTCPCCVESYNKGARSEVKCYFGDCNYSSCKDCVRTYLTGTTNEPHCMKCRKKWDLEFTKTSLNSSFMQKEYKAHRQTILADRTISQIQEYYPDAILMNQRRKDEAEAAVVEKEVDELHKLVAEKYRKINEIRNRHTKASESAERRKFVMPCQTGGCRGMLSTAYKCDLCEKFTCAKCLESIEGAKDDHVCVQANVETAEEIRKNTRPCPNCGCRISKIDGCFAENTPILLWNGEIKMSQHICVGDELVGDDGNKRIVEDVCSGEDDLYEVQQNNGNTYIVNSKHTLVLQECGKSEIIHKTIDEYMKLTNTMKNNLYGLKSRNGINRANTAPNKDYFKTSISVKKIGFGDYYGWNINDNHRFVLSDFTVVKNCDQMWCIECKTAFSWAKGTVEVGMVHNPHYYQWMRQNGGMPRADGMPPGAGCNENQLVTQLRFVRDMFSTLSCLKIFETDFIKMFDNCGYSEKKIMATMPTVYENCRELRTAMQCEELETHKKTISHEFFLNFHRYIVHLERVVLAQLNYSIRSRNDHNTPIYHYILGEQTKAELSDYLIKRDTANAKDGAHRDILEAMIMVGKQVLMDLSNELSAIQVDFSWRLIGEQLGMMRMNRNNNTEEYARDRLTIFSKFYTVFYSPNKEGIENMFRQCSLITRKYMRAVNQYAAYSNAETIKYLMLYGTKKQVYLWDSETDNARYFKYDLKETYLRGLEKYRAELAKYSEKEN